MTEQVIPLDRNDPAQIGRYRVIGVLGHGGMGKVYLGLTANGMRVAIKVIHPAYAQDPAFRERFTREVEMAQRVSSPYTARVVEANAYNRTPWLATEYIPGPTLGQALTKHGRLPEASVRLLAAGLAEALRDIHAEQIVHRDLKPSNVILSDAGPRLIDFGIARPVDGHGLTASGDLIGTLEYMSPEQLARNRVTQKSDVFSLGKVLAHAAIGRAPTYRGGVGSMPGTADLRDVPPALREIIRSCLETDPEKRATLQAVIRQLGPFPADYKADWLPRELRTFVLTTMASQRDSITSLMAAWDQPRPPWRPKVPSWHAEIGPSVRGLRRAYGSLSTRLLQASRNWPILSETSLRNWSFWCLWLGMLGLVEVVSRTPEVQAIRHGPLPWLKVALTVRAAVVQFTAWIPDPIASWLQSAGSARQGNDRLAIVSCVLILLMTIARRFGRNHLGQVAVKATATYLGIVITILMAMRMLQTGFGPLIGIAEYLRWWGLVSLAVACLLVWPLAGRVR